MPEQQATDPIVQVDAFLDKFFERRDAGMAPVWAAEHEMAKTFVALSSGALVLTVSLAQFLADRLPHPGWGWLLASSWVCFGIAVITGVIRHGWAAAAQSYRARFEPSRGELRAALIKLPRDEHFTEAAEGLIAAALQRANIEPAEATRIHDQLITTSGWAFIIGVVLLTAFAIHNLPF